MLTYEQLKTFLEEHKMKFMLGAAFVLVFLAGFGTGSYEKSRRANLKSSNDYSIKSSSKQNTAVNEQGMKAQDNKETAEADASAEVLGTTTPATTACKIKGNISSGNRKIYHVPGGSYYKTVNPEMCFNTEAEAMAAGFKKSGR